VSESAHGRAFICSPSERKQPPAGPLTSNDGTRNALENTLAVTRSAGSVLVSPTSVATHVVAGQPRRALPRVHQMHAGESCGQTCRRRTGTRSGSPRSARIIAAITHPSLQA